MAFMRRRLFWSLLLAGLIAGIAFLSWHPLRDTMSAQETAAFLAGQYPSQTGWRCVKGDYRWDYECAPKGRFQTEGFGVRVDADSVTARSAP
jgi:hypothetical protein